MATKLHLLYSTEPFHGVKIAIKNDEEKLLLHLRDNKPGLFNANMWDFGGGGRERNETPMQCITREIKEEFGISIRETDIDWVDVFPAQKDPNQKALFCVAKIDSDRLKAINLQEGQRYELFTVADFLADPQVISAIKDRYRVYINSK